MEDKIKMYPYFNVEVQKTPDNEAVVTFKSILRIKGEDGIYYLTRFKDKYKSVNGEELDLESLVNLMNRANKLMYTYTMCTKCPSNTTYLTGEPLFIKDEDQTDEKDRLLKTY